MPGLWCPLGSCVNLIAQGYSALTIVFIAVLVVPLLSVGLWQIHRALKPSAADTPHQGVQTVNGGSSVRE